MSLDPVTLEVLRHRFDAIADNMESTLIRCAYSTIIKEGGDCSVALFDIEGNTVAQGLALPVHLGSMPPAVKSMLRAHPAKDMAEGDVVIMNDPYDGGQHNPDIICIVPVVDAGETVALAVSLAHQQDVGGRTPGSNPVDATDVYEEGLCIPPVKFFERGTMNPVVEAFLRRNVRYPDLLFGDLNAQIACGTTAAAELKGLIGTYGRDLIVEAMAALMDRAETLTRREIERIPDGTYSFTDWLDNDGIELDKRIAIKSNVTIAGSDIHVDFAGTSPQVRGPLNSVPSCALSAVRYVIKVLTDPTIPNNEGCYRMLRVSVPERTVLNPVRPAAVNCRAVTLRRCVDATMGAMAQALPGRVPAASNGHPLQGHFGGYDEATGRHFIVSEMGTGGMGGRPSKDGIDCIFTDTSNSANIPVEVAESTTPMRIRFYRIRTGSGGAGRYRGGCGFEKEYECLADNVILSHRGERHYTQPWGQAGGGPGASSWTTVIRADGSEHKVPSKQTIVLNHGDRVVMATTGGGGYGDPLERPPEAVLDDLLDRKISRENARDDYGVVFKDDSVDTAATTRLRQNMRTTAPPVENGA